MAFHLLAWLALAIGAAQWPSYAGSLGWPLAALHLVTLGVLGMTAMGAGAQLLPVATRRPAPGHRLLAVVWCVYTPGVGALALGMGMALPPLMAAGAAAVVLALAGWAGLMMGNLRGARGMPGVVAHGWTALVSLGVVLASALLLAALWLGWPVAGREIPLALHRAFAPYGFMGMLVLGLSYILVPMFALADAPGERIQLGSCALAVAALLLGAAGAFGVAPAATYGAALLCAGMAVALHLRAMSRVLRGGMRRELGRSFTLVKVGWAGLVASLVLALGLAWQWPVPRLATWFGLCLIGVWLLSFLLGLLQRIVPFLAAMHAAGHGRRAPTPSSLTHEPALRAHFICHLTALALLGGAIALESTWLAAAGAVAGSAGALAFGLFFATVVRRLRTPVV